MEISVKIELTAYLMKREYATKYVNPDYILGCDKEHYLQCCKKIVEGTTRIPLNDYLQRINENPLRFQDFYVVIDF